MKLRIKGDSIRLRLTQTEVHLLGETGSVSETLHVGAGPGFEYRLQAHDVPDLAAARTADSLTVLVPAAWARGWFDNDTVGFSRAATVGADPSPSILVEKDFACLDERPDELDAFPNPDASTC